MSFRKDAAMENLSDGSRLGGKMTISPDLPPEPAVEMEPIYALWDDLDRFPAGHSEEALAHLLSGLKHLVHADNVRWLGVVRVLRGAQARKDFLQGWRIGSSVALAPDPPAHQRHSAWWYRQEKSAASEIEIGLATRAMVAGFGQFQAHRMRDGWIPFDEFSQSAHYDLHYTKLGIADRMWLSVPVNADTESMFLIDRIGRKAPFSRVDAHLAAATLRGIRGFHRRLFLDRGLLVGESALSPVARRIVQRLLTGLSEKEIAGSMNQSPATTHKYVKAIYARFGVNGRPALMSLWLRA